MEGNNISNTNNTNNILIQPIRPLNLTEREMALIKPGADPQDRVKKLVLPWAVSGLNENDVVLDMNEANHNGYYFVGNIRFLNTIKSSAVAYHRNIRNENEKRRIINQVLSVVHFQSPPGRFVTAHLHPSNTPQISNKFYTADFRRVRACVIATFDEVLGLNLNGRVVARNTIGGGSVGSIISQNAVAQSQSSSSQGNNNNASSTAGAASPIQNAMQQQQQQQQQQQSSAAESHQFQQQKYDTLHSPLHPPRALVQAQNQINHQGQQQHHQHVNHHMAQEHKNPIHGQAVARATQQQTVQPKVQIPLRKASPLANDQTKAVGQHSSSNQGQSSAEMVIEVIKEHQSKQTQPPPSVVQDNPKSQQQTMISQVRPKLQNARLSAKELKEKLCHQQQERKRRNESSPEVIVLEDSPTPQKRVKENVISVNDYLKELQDILPLKDFQEQDASLKEELSLWETTPSADVVRALRVQLISQHINPVLVEQPDKTVVALINKTHKDQSFNDRVNQVSHYLLAKLDSANIYVADQERQYMKN